MRPWCDRARLIAGALAVTLFAAPAATLAQAPAAPAERQGRPRARAREPRRAQGRAREEGRQVAGRRRGRAARGRRGAAHGPRRGGASRAALDGAHARRRARACASPTRSCSQATLDSGRALVEAPGLDALKIVTGGGGGSRPGPRGRSPPGPLDARDVSRGALLRRGGRLDRDPHARARHGGRRRARAGSPAGRAGGADGGPLARAGPGVRRPGGVAGAALEGHCARLPARDPAGGLRRGAAAARRHGVAR